VWADTPEDFTTDFTMLSLDSALKRTDKEDEGAKVELGQCNEFVVQCTQVIA